MTSPSPLRSTPRRLVLPGAIALVTVGVDLATKGWAVEHLAGRPAVVVVPGLLTLELGVNPGTAFGLLGGGPRVWPVLLGVLVLAYLLWLGTRLPGSSAGSFGAAAIGLGLMLGGTVGNLYDRGWRIVDDGNPWGPGPRSGVVDFIGVARWPRFNLADAALVVGAAVLLLGMLVAAARASTRD
ncbi:MAG: signal peptidase II [Nannocystaceae bacterium]